MKNLTKESRLNSRNYQFSKLIENGYTQDTYKELDFFTKQDGKYFTLKVFRGTAANHVLYMNYHTAEIREVIIQNFKTNYDSRQTYKAEQKEKNKGKSSSHAGAAAAIKAELKAKFPYIKFSVTSESFSMGDSVHISWSDGVTTKEVAEISNKYEYGHFNGMEDIYEMTNRRDDIPQAKYVSESRSMSEETKAILQPIAEKLFDSFKSDNNPRPFNCWDASQFLHQIFYNTSFVAGAKPINIIETGETCGLNNPEIFYKIDFDNTEIKATEQPTQQKTQQKPFEVKTGEINIVDYSEKAFAVIGDTKTIKEQLKALGGSFNPRLSCGAGWIFSKKKLEEVTKALTEETQEIEPIQQKEILALPYPQEPETVKSEVKKMIEFFAKTDIEMCGEITESTKECARVQNVSLSIIKEETPKHYDNLKDIEEAAKGGKVISLCNLYELVKTK